MGLGDSPPPLCRHIRHTHTHDTHTHKHARSVGRIHFWVACVRGKSAAAVRGHTSSWERKNNPRKYQMEEFLAES